MCKWWGGRVREGKGEDEESGKAMHLAAALP